MIIKVMDFRYKTIKVPVTDEGGNQSFVQETVLTPKYNLVRREISFIEDFCEYSNQKGQIYKNRCLLKEPNGEWLVVNHSFNELYNMKYKKIVGFMRNLNNYEDQPSFEKIRKNGKQKIGRENKRISKEKSNKRSSS